MRPVDVAWVVVLLAGCGGAARDPRALPDAGRPPRNEAGIILTTTTEAGVTTACTCILPEDWDFGGISTCDAPSVAIGCRENPSTAPRVFDLQPRCWMRPPLTDPETGCPMPDTTFCEFSCFGSDRLADAEPARDAELDGGAATSTHADAR